LENIATALAEAQKTGAAMISTLEGQLQNIDNELGRALDLEDEGDLTAAEEALVDQHITDLVRDAITDTKTAVGQLQTVRNGYSNFLERSLTNLRLRDGYDPAPIEGADADGQPSHAERDRKAIEGYNAHQRAADEALANGPGPLTPEKADAAARLRDYATATNGNADPDARRLASERLDDFAMARFSGPLPVDRVLGGDARARAQMRLEWQKKLEEGFSGAPAMTPDQVTQMLDNGEQQARAVVTQQAVKGLVSKGMSPSAAMTVARGVTRGVPWAEMVKQQGQVMTLSGAGVDGTIAARGGRHAVDAFTPADIEAFEKVGKALGRGGTLVEVALAANDYMHGAGLGATIGKTGGSIAGGWLGATGGGALAGSVVGPEGAFVGAILGAAVVGFGGEQLGGAVGGFFDK
ncbi:putative alpha/beta hydrolase, partial [Mycobacterium malmoense]|uniref:putative alpha/beta hydrolase n=1 Tax=Mycobacterium malmoense TaxID=1780 RepID=UPI003F885B85